MNDDEKWRRDGDKAAGLLLLAVVGLWAWLILAERVVMDGVKFCVLTDLSEAYKLRYEVYRERGYIEPNDSGIDTDQYDAHSIHIGAVSDKLVGYVRLILPPELPVYDRCKLYHEYQDLKQYAECGEISRLVTLPEYRKGVVAAGLYSAVVDAGHDAGLKRCVALMEPGLARLVTFAGFQVKRIGFEISFLGKVIPYLLTP
jgi:N-acyl-L-homoserine lactone synthetase